MNIDNGVPNPPSEQKWLDILRGMDSKEPFFVSTNSERVAFSTIAKKYGGKVISRVHKNDNGEVDGYNVYFGKQARGNE